jgi:hypothetical protein
LINHRSCFINQFENLDNLFERNNHKKGVISLSETSNVYVIAKQFVFKFLNIKYLFFKVFLDFNRNKNNSHDDEDFVCHNSSYEKDDKEDHQSPDKWTKWTSYQANNSEDGQTSKLSSRDLICWSMQIARAMNYLESKNVFKCN